MHETVESTAVIDGSSSASTSSSRTISTCRKAGSTSACATPSSARRRGCTTTSATPCWRSCAPTSSTSTSRRAAASPRSASSRSARAISTCARRSTSSGIDEVKCNDLGLRLYKIGCPWPISRRDLKEFAEGLEQIIVVEEKRSLIEVQVREELYGTANQPVCIGKKDEQGNWLFPVKGALDPNESPSASASASCSASAPTRRSPGASRGSRRRSASGRDTRTSRCARPISAPAARTIPRPWCRKACAPMRASAAITWRSGWTARRSATPRWAARAPTGSARRRSPSGRMCSRTSATAPTTIPATWRSAAPSRRASTSPTRSCSTTRSR